MTTIGSFEAKTHLSTLLERVAKGETIVITKHGKHVARLVPPENREKGMSVEEAISGLLEFRKSHRLNSMEIRELIREGQAS